MLIQFKSKFKRSYIARELRTKIYEREKDSTYFLLMYVNLIKMTIVQYILQLDNVPVSTEITNHSACSSCYILNIAKYNYNLFNKIRSQYKLSV